MPRRRGGSTDGASAQAKEKMMNEKLRRETLAGVKDVGRRLLCLFLASLAP